MHRWKPLRQMKATDPDITSVLMPCDLNQLVQHVIHCFAVAWFFCPAPAEGYRKGSEGVTGLPQHGGQSF